MEFSFNLVPDQVYGHPLLSERETLNHHLQREGLGLQGSLCALLVLCQLGEREEDKRERGEGGEGEGERERGGEEGDEREGEGARDGEGGREGGRKGEMREREKGGRGPYLAAFVETLQRPTYPTNLVFCILQCLIQSVFPVGDVQDPAMEVGVSAMLCPLGLTC